MAGTAKQFYFLDGPACLAEVPCPTGLVVLDSRELDAEATLPGLLESSFAGTVDAWYYSVDYVKERLVPYLQRDPGALVVVADATSGKPVGMVLAWCDRFDETGGSEPGKLGRIHWLAVDPGYRRRGIAKFLLCTALQRHAQRARTAVYLSTESDRAAAIALYESMGFKRVDTRPTEPSSTASSAASAATGTVTGGGE